MAYLEPRTSIGRHTNSHGCKRRSTGCGCSRSDVGDQGQGRRSCCASGARGCSSCRKTGRHRLRRKRRPSRPSDPPLEWLWWHSFGPNYEGEPIWGDDDIPPEDGEEADEGDQEETWFEPAPPVGGWSNSDDDDTEAEDRDSGHPLPIEEFPPFDDSGLFDDDDDSGDDDDDGYDDDDDTGGDDDDEGGDDDDDVPPNVLDPDMVDLESILNEDDCIALNAEIGDSPLAYLSDFDPTDEDFCDILGGCCNWGSVDGEYGCVCPVSRTAPGVIWDGQYCVEVPDAHAFTASGNFGNPPDPGGLLGFGLACLCMSPLDECATAVSSGCAEVGTGD